MADATAGALTFDGVLLAGGLSSRMGRNKALITFDGVVLWRIQLGLLATAGGGEMRVSVRHGVDWLPAEVPRVEDDGSAGPLGGIAAALAVTRATHLMVMAVDLPEMTSAWWTQLREVCRPGIGAVGRHGHSHFEPLAAIYPVELADEARRAVEQGRLSLQDFVSDAIAAGTIREVTIAPNQIDWFKNLNSPEDVGS